MPPSRSEPPLLPGDDSNKQLLSALNEESGSDVVADGKFVIPALLAKNRRRVGTQIALVVASIATISLILKAISPKTLRRSDSLESVGFEQQIVTYKVLDPAESDTCGWGDGSYPIEKKDDCLAAAKDHGLFTNVSDLTETDVTHFPKGCYYNRTNQTLYLGVSDLMIGKLPKDSQDIKLMCRSDQYKTLKELGQCPSCAPEWPVKPTVIIPFYERDLCKLKYTLKSIEVHDPEKHLGEIILMWISLKPAEMFKDKINPMVYNLRQQDREVRLLDFHAQVLYSRTNGWFAQQILKLKIASMVKSDWYLVLDSKNAFLKDIKADTFFDSCNRAKFFAEYHWSNMPEPHAHWFKKTAYIYNLTDHPQGWLPMSITPISLHKQTVLNMLQLLGENSATDSLCQGRLCELLMAPAAGDEHHATEFALYILYAFMKSSTKLECLHTVDTLDIAHRWAISLWRGVPGNRRINVAQNIRSSAAIASGQWAPLMFGAQPDSLEGMTAEEEDATKKNVIKIYANAKLFLDEKEEELVDCVVATQEDIM